MAFRFTMPTVIHYGKNSFINKVPDLVNVYNCKKILFITGGRGAEIIPDFRDKEKIEWKYIKVTKEPSEIDVLKALKITESFEPDLLISIGGGSVIDLGKALSYLSFDNRGVDYFFQNPYVEKEKIPHIAVPTTFGTGAEVTANAVISRDNFKVSLRANAMRPDITILDPIFTRDLPLSVLYSSSLDSLTQLIESYVSNKAHSLSDVYCREGLQLFQKSFQIHRLEELSDDERLDLQLAACYSGVALSNSKLGVIHGVASIIGERYKLPHGKICAGLVRPFSKLNVEMLRKEKNHQVLAKYKSISEILHQNHHATIDGLFKLLQQYESAFNTEFKLPKGRVEEVYKVAQDSHNASSTQGNPVKLTVEQLKNTLEAFYK